MQPEIASLRREVAALRREVRRQRRRAWLLPLAVALALTPLAGLAANPFRDLNPGSPHNGNIDAIYNAGVTTGCVPQQEYCPNGLVTREEMASFLARVGGLGNNPAVANARTVNGFFANDLVRVNGNGSGDAVFAVSTVYQIATGVSLVLPYPGFVLVTAQVTFNAGGFGTNAVVSWRLIDTASGFATIPVSASVSGTSATQAASPTAVFFANSGGPRFFALQGGYSGTGPVQSRNAIVTALYVPFGPGGGFASEAGGMLEPADIPPPDRPQP